MFRDVYHIVRYIRCLYKLYYDQSETHAQQVKNAATKCGAIGVKLLQFLVSNEGFLDPHCVNKLEFVFEDNETHDFEDTETMYLKDFGVFLHEDFEVSEDDKFPVGSGTIAQVYKLFNKKQNTYVAVKVKHPNIDAQALRFTYCLSMIIRTLELFMTVPFVFLLKEYVSNIHVQLDFTQEAQNTSIMKDKCKNDPHIVIPTIHKFSPQFIVMSYHDGKRFNDITDENIRKQVSIDIYFFMVASLLQYKYVHCDLHVGNWKVTLSGDKYDKLIVYDCGLICSVRDDDSAKKIMMGIFNNNDFVSMLKILVTDWESEPQWPALIEYVHTIETKDTDNYADKYTTILRYFLEKNIPLNANVVRLCQSLVMCMRVINVTRSKLSKIIGDSSASKDVMLNYNYSLLEKVGKYKPLKKIIKEWIDEDPSCTVAYEEWLMDTFGHKNSSVFVDLTVDGLVL